MARTASAGAMLIFDLDGTLFRTETVTVPAAREAFAAHGLDPPGEAEICSFIGRTAAEYGAWLRTRCPPPAADAILRAAAERELELLGPRGRLYPGVCEALAELRGAVPTMAVCSNGSGRYVEAVLAACRIDGFFDVVRFRRPGDVAKPQMVGELLGRQGGGPRRPGVVIGDRHDDVEAARANGLLAVGCAYGYGGPGELDAADAVAAAAPEIPSLVRALLDGEGG